MNREIKSSPQAADSPHTLIAAEPSTPRHRAPLFYLGALGLVLGVAAGIMWLSQSGLGALDLARNATPVSVATPLAAPTVVNAPASIEPATIAPAEAPADAAAPAALQPVLAERAAAAPTPTATASPVPYLERIEGVVGLGGADVWDEGGQFVGRLAQGVLLSVQARSADDVWLYVTAESGLGGWVAADAAIVFDTARLHPREIVLIPLTPEPALAQPAATAANGEAPLALLPTPTAAESMSSVMPSAGESKGGMPLGALPTARVRVESGRLNVRSGPDASQPVLAKAQPDEVYRLLGRSSDGGWLQIEMPDLAGGFGWVAAEYMEAGADLSSLPVRSDVSAAPVFGSVAATATPTPTLAPDAGESGAPDVVTPSPTADRRGLPAPVPPLRQRPAPTGQSSGSDAGSATGLSGTLVIQTVWGGDISLYNLATGELRLLTGGFDPSLSPDGSQVAFTREGGENGVYVIDVATGEERLIFGGRQHLRSPKWSADGRWVVFVRGDEYILCKNDPSRCGISAELPSGEFPERERQPALARVSADGGKYEDLPVLQYAGAPDWSVDGVVYQSLGGIQITQDAPGADTQLVYFDILKQYELDPDWQPRTANQAGVIAFHQREASHWEIYVVNPDGSGLHALTQPPFALAESFPSNVAPAWSPDGEHIVYLSNRTAQNTAGAWRVWVMDKDGANQRPLPLELPFVYTYVSEQMLDWGP